MKNLENLTVIIVTYLTQKKMLTDCLKSISKDVKIKIIENSSNFELKDEITNVTFDKKPVAVLPNANNYGYCRIRFDKASLKIFIERLKDVELS